MATPWPGRAWSQGPGDSLGTEGTAGWQRPQDISWSQSFLRSREVKKSSARAQGFPACGRSLHWAVG